MRLPATGVRSFIPVFRAIVVRPRLWYPSIRQALVLAPVGWWRRAPFLPLPSVELLEFRAVTQYGSTTHAMDPHDVVDYVRWCSSMRGLDSTSP